MCNETQIVRVKIPADLSCTGKAKWKRAGIDACISSLVAAIQQGGIDMRGSCCGHGRHVGHIDLADGRGLIILNPTQNRLFLGTGEIDAARQACGEGDKPKMAELFTVVNRQTGEPVAPFDCNPQSDDEGMLVYWSRHAAELSAEHQADMYGLDCEARGLDRVVAAKWTEEGDKPNG